MLGHVPPLSKHRLELLSRHTHERPLDGLKVSVRVRSFTPQAGCPSAGSIVVLGADFLKPQGASQAAPWSQAKDRGFPSRCKRAYWRPWLPDMSHARIRHSCTAVIPYSLEELQSKGRRAHVHGFHKAPELQNFVRPVSQNECSLPKVSAGWRTTGCRS